jgi:hypothetical protein
MSVSSLPEKTGATTTHILLVKDLCETNDYIEIRILL